MATIKRDGYLHRLYLWGTEDKFRWEYKQSLNLCSVFWTCLFKGLLAVVSISAAGLLLAFTIACAITDPKNFIEFLVVIGFMALGIASLLTVCIGAGWSHHTITSSETWAFIKGNYCPQIKVED